MYLLFPANARAQNVDVYGRAGVAGSTALVKDQVATAQMSVLLGSPVDEEVQAVPAPGLQLGAGIRFAFWERVRLGAELSWTATELEARDDAGTRPIQDLSVLQGTVAAHWLVRPSVELGAGAGLTWYRTDERGLFEGGSDAAPVVEASAAWTPPVLGERLALVGAVQTHRFGTPALRSAGGQDGNVARWSLGVRIRLLETGQ